MKPVPLIIRRAHLYTTLICLPWFLMYGITAVAFNHADWFEGPNDLYDLSGPNWTHRQSWPCSIDVPREGDLPREIAVQMLKIADMEAAAFSVFRSGEQQVSANITEFWNTRRLVYDMEREQLSLYTRRPLAFSTMTLMHARASYRHQSFLNDLWAVMVDAVVIGILLWVATGLFMWWQQRDLRKLGGIALAAGVITFAAFLISL